MDELDREDFYRLKCVQDKKKEAKEEEMKEMAERKAKLGGDPDAQKAEEDEDPLDEKN